MDVDGQPPIIQMLDVDSTTSQGREEINLGAVEEVVIFTLESRVLLLFDFENHVTGENAGHLITLAAEFDLVTVLHTSVDMDMKDLPLNNRLLTATALATVAVADHLSFTIAVGTHGLEALDHGAHLAHHRLHTRTVTARALADSTFLSTSSLTSRANDRLLQSQFRDLATIDILKADFVDVVNGSRFLGTLITHAASKHAAEGTAAAEELREEVLGAHAASSGTTMFQTLFTILVVNLALLRIGQDFIGVGEFLELLSCIGVVCVLVCTAKATSSADCPLKDQ